MVTFAALSDKEFRRIREAEQTHKYELVVIDLGYARYPVKSCGLAWQSSSGQTQTINVCFGVGVEQIGERIIEIQPIKTPLLVIEAPLSMRFKKGCPVRRGTFEGPLKKKSKNGNGYEMSLGWYHGAGATVTLSAARLLQQLSKKLAGHDRNIYLAEAFLSAKNGTKTSHAKDANCILSKFWNGEPDPLQTEGLEPLTELFTGIPCVRVLLLDKA